MTEDLSSQTIQRQYKVSSNLEARIYLHQRFSVNPLGWHRWVFNQLNLRPEAVVLEVGCGAGQFWLDNAGRIPARWRFVLTDFSALVRTRGTPLAASSPSGT